MKIPTSLRIIYNQQKEIADRLKELVDSLLSNRIKDTWHYYSRVKSDQSFALKIESGRVSDPTELQDFFACTIVVENHTTIKEAEALIRNQFKFVTRRPNSQHFTHKPPDSFPFDDLRLYVRWMDPSDLPPSGVNGCLFEVQIKTFLQHAWSISTHDLTYKTDDVSWPKQRIASQIKAMLEHVEISIAEADTLSLSQHMSKTDKQTNKLNIIIEMLRGFWEPDLLPHDMRRLAENIISLTNALKMEVACLKQVIEIETKRGNGASICNLSPYNAIVQSIISQMPDSITRYLNDESGLDKFLIFIPPEIEMLEVTLPENSDRLLCLQ